MDLVFEWDPRKNQNNLKKHRVASSVFGDPLARIFLDEGHSTEEQREIIVGHSQRNRLLLVCFTELENGRVRIVSARPATRTEQHDYEENVKS